MRKLPALMQTSLPLTPDTQEQGRAARCHVAYSTRAVPPSVCSLARQRRNAAAGTRQRCSCVQVAAELKREHGLHVILGAEFEFTLLRPAPKVRGQPQQYDPVHPGPGANYASTYLLDEYASGASFRWLGMGERG